MGVANIQYNRVIDEFEDVRTKLKEGWTEKVVIDFLKCKKCSYVSIANNQIIVRQEDESDIVICWDNCENCYTEVSPMIIRFVFLRKDGMRIVFSFFEKSEYSPGGVKIFTIKY